MTRATATASSARRDQRSEQATPRLRGRKAVEQRKRRLAQEPLCRDCFNAKPQRIRAATVPDHIIPLSKGGPDTDDNIRCLCADCHRTRTAEQFGHRQIAGCDASGWPMSPDHHWNRT